MKSKSSGRASGSKGDDEVPAAANGLLDRRVFMGAGALAAGLGAGGLAGRPAGAQALQVEPYMTSTNPDKFLICCRQPPS